jgi:hypothetical protein
MQHEPARCRPRPRRLVGRVLVVAAISTGTCACGDMSSSSPVDTRYDFAACQDVWPPATDPDGSYVKCRGGAYEVRVMSAQRPEVSRVVYGPAQARVAIAADVMSAPEQSSQGVGCWRDPAHGYLFMTATDGEFAILRVSSEGLGSPARLAVGWDPGAASTAGTTTLSATCASVRTGTVLVLQIGGHSVARVTDHAGLRGFTRAGFVVFGAQAGPVTVRFDNLRLSTPRAPEAAPDGVVNARTLLTDSFRNGRNWFTGVDGGVAGRVKRGRYLLAVTRGYQVIEPAVSLSRPVDSLYVETIMQAAGTSDQAAGVTCYAGSNGTTGWAFAVQPDGTYSIRDVADDSELTGGALSHPLDGSVRLGAYCKRGTDGMTLGLDIDGVRVAQTTVSGERSPLTQVGVYLDGSHGSHAAFEAIQAGEVTEG